MTVQDFGATSNRLRLPLREYLMLSLGLADTEMRYLVNRALPIFAGLFFSMLSTILLARIAGPAEFGTYIYALAWISAAAIMSKAGHEWVLLKGIPELRARNELSQIRSMLQSCFTAVFLRSLLFSTILVCAVLLFETDVEPAILLSSALLVVVLALAELRRSWALSYHAIWLSDAPESIVKSIVLVAIAYALSRDSGNVPAGALITANLLVTVATASMATIAFIALKEPQLMSTPATPVIKGQYGTVAANMWISNCVNILLRSADIMVVGALTDAVSTGIYAAASRLAMLAVAPVMVLDRLVAPMISQQFEQGDMLALRKTIRGHVALTSLSSLLLFGVFLTIGSELLAGIVGPAYDDALPLIQILMLGNVVLSVMGPAGIVLAVTGGDRTSRNIAVTSALISLALLMVLTPAFGVKGAAFAATTSIGMKASLLAFYARKAIACHTSVLVFMER